MAKTLSIAALTMVRDDPEFLDIWLRYYGGLLGRRALYVVADGDLEAVREQAAGANVIGMPAGPPAKFDARRWRMLNHLVQCLRISHDRVIVGDVDEIVLADPEVGSLHDVLAAHRKVPVVTPLGLEVVHRPCVEPAPLSVPLLAGRRHVRVAPLYTKPACIAWTVRLSRGGHYSDCATLTMPNGLYLLHLKHCDRGLYARTMDRRNALAAASGAARPRDAMIGRHWFAQGRDDAATFAALDNAPVAPDFDLAPARAAMHAGWRPRGDTGFWHSNPPEDPHLYQLPARFADLL